MNEEETNYLVDGQMITGFQAACGRASTIFNQSGAVVAVVEHRRHAMNWDDPAERYALIERVGPDEYNRLQQQHFKDSAVDTVNGYPIRPVIAGRYGRIYTVGNTGIGFDELEKARIYARTQPPGPETPKANPD